MGKLSGVVVCISGHPENDKDSNRHIREQFTDENVSNWLNYRGGKLVEEVNKDTTHLVCSKSAYKKQDNVKVKAAKEHGCKLVTYEWLTDTLQLLEYHDRKAPVNLYHPGEHRDDKTIAKLFRVREKKAKTSKKSASPAMGDSFAKYGKDHDSGAEEEAAGVGMKHLSIAEDTNSQNVSNERDNDKVSVVGDEGKRNDTEATDHREGENMPVNEKRGKQNEKPDKKGESMVKEPPVDLGLYSVCKDELGLYRIEIWKPDKHGNERGSRCVLELYESKSEPKTYLFGAKKYPKQSSSRCLQQFSAEALGEKEHEFKAYRTTFRQYTGISWRDRDSTPSTGPIYYLSKAATGKGIGNIGQKNKFDEVRENNDQSPTSFLNGPREHHDGDGEASAKRKSNFSEERPLKALKVTKASAGSNSAKVTHKDCKPSKT